MHIKRLCMFPNSSNVGITKDKPKLSYKQVVVKQNNASPLTQSIQKIPTVARALSAASAAKDRVAITRSQKELTIQGTGSSGVRQKQVTALRVYWLWVSQLKSF